MEHSTITTTSAKSATASSGGFAMLYTVLLVSLILSIAVSISNLTLRQAVLSNLAKDSGIAFYQADAGVECGMYQDTYLGNYTFYNQNDPVATVPTPQPTFQCGEKTMALDSSVSYTNFYVYNTLSADTAKPCFSITFDKRTVLDPGGHSYVKSSGSNICGPSPRKVERALQVMY